MATPAEKTARLTQAETAARVLGLMLTTLCESDGFDVENRNEAAWDSATGAFIAGHGAKVWELTPDFWAIEFADESTLLKRDAEYTAFANLFDLMESDPLFADPVRGREREAKALDPTPIPIRTRQAA